MKSNDITVQILKDIRGELREVRAAISETNTRLEEMRTGLSPRIDETNARLDATREELSRRIVESEVRTSTAITDLAGTVRELVTVLRSSDLRPRVEKCEEEIAGIKRRLPAA